MNKNEDAWSILFERFGIHEKISSSGPYFIGSAEINKLRESRLMTKFDHKANLPDIFSKNRLAILPVTRGSYAIGDFEAYVTQSYDPVIETEEYEFPPNIESLRPENLYSESAAINCAFVSGMIDDIVGEKTVPTVSGRMGTSEFDFRIRRTSSEGYHSLKVDNSQCEIDGGFEGDSTLVILEAKNAITEDFIIRQLYYPYRLWSKRISKKVVPAFLSYSNDVFHFFVYEFREEGDYNSIQLIKQRNFVLAPERIELEDIQKVLDSTTLVPEPSEPFPQADKFERIVDLLGLLAGGLSEGSMITSNYDFDPRQTQYYTSAGKYLGLIEGRGGIYFLTKAASQLLRLSYKSKYLALAKTILAHEVFRKVCLLYLSRASRPSRTDVIEIMKGSKLYRVESDATYNRRAQTILSWIDWIFGLQNYGA